MGKARKPARRDERGPLQRVVDAERTEREQSVISVITPEQRQKGTYQGERLIVNNHDPVARWVAAKRLTDSQQLAIGYVRRLWDIAGLERPVTANYGHVSIGAGCAERRAAIEIDAREDLHRCQDYVPMQYWSIFELVCRWGEPAGVAGGSLGFGDRSGAERAHQVVCFVADVVAMKERL